MRSSKGMLSGWTCAERTACTTAMPTFSLSDALLQARVRTLRRAGRRRGWYADVGGGEVGRRGGVRSARGRSNVHIPMDPLTSQAGAWAPGASAGGTPVLQSPAAAADLVQGCARPVLGRCALRRDTVRPVEGGG